MILFVFEGVKREPDLFRTIQRLYFANRDEQINTMISNSLQIKRYIEMTDMTSA